MEAHAPEAAAGDLTIRRDLRPGDADAIVALHDDVYPAEHGVDRTFVDDIRITLDELEATGFPGGNEGVWIVEREGEVAGCLMLSDEGGGEGRVRLFLLARELRGQGVGGRLLSELLELARRARYERLTLSTFSDLKAAASLYRHAGFRLVGEDRSPRWGRERFRYQQYELTLEPA
jgi:peptidyl-dipeptidase Dcp